MRAGSVIAAVSLVVILALAAYAVSVMHGSGNGSSDGPAPEEPGEGLTGIHVTGLPEGFSVSGDDTIMAPGEVTWHVTDNLHTFYDVSGSGSFTERYSGYDVTSPSLTLDVGAYTVTAEGCEFIVVVYGDIVRSVSWTYDMDGVRVEAVIEYTISLEDLLSSTESSRGFNSAHNNGTSASFDLLPEMVVTDSLTDAVERALSDEYVRIGGDSSDAQGYLDFIASFVQLNVRYPGTIREDGSVRGWDYGIYGADEYWALPQETLYHLYGDCEDNSALLCALYIEAGYQVAMGGKSGHVFAGVALEGFEEIPDSRLDDLGVGYLTLTMNTAVGGTDGTVYYAVETIRGQTPVGYTTWTAFGDNTFWGTTGFYPVSG